MTGRRARAGAPDRGGAPPGGDADARPAMLHGSAVAFAGRGVLILGPAGAGKSALALRLMALGADLVADDRVQVQRIAAGPPDTAAGGAEAGDPAEAGTAAGDPAAGGPGPEGAAGPKPPGCSDRGGALVLSAPPGLPALIEARGVGLLGARRLASARLALVVDLGATETDRLPPRRVWHWCGIAVDCVHGSSTPHFPAAIRQYLLWGRGA